MTDDELFAQASAWHFRLQAEDAGERDRHDFAAWLAQSDEHARAWEEARQLLAILQPAAHAVHRAAPARRRRALPWAAAATLLLAIGLGATQTPWLDRLRADQATRVGEVRTLALEDGSRIQLNTDSAVQIALGDHERRVRLLRGEAWFEVSRDAGRPFFVESAGGWVRVVGTRFSVTRRGDETQVRLQSGRVEVAAGGEPIQLMPGQGVAFSSAGLQAVAAFDPQQAFAWRHRQLVFRQQPLGEVVAELNRYWPGRLFVVGAELERKQVSGVFDIDRPEAVLRALQLTLGLRAEHYTRYLTLLHAGS